MGLVGNVCCGSLGPSAESQVGPYIRRIHVGDFGSRWARWQATALAPCSTRERPSRHLESISVDDNFLGEDLLEELRSLGTSIVSAQQKDDDLSIPGEIHRYLSMAE